MHSSFLSFFSLDEKNQKSGQKYRSALQISASLPIFVMPRFLIFETIEN